ELARLGHDTQTVAVAFSPDGRFVAAGGGYRAVTLWRVSSGTRVWQSALDWENGDAYRLNSLSFSPDGKSLAGRGGPRGDAGRREYAVDVWEVATGKERCRLGRNLEGIYAVAFSPGGRMLASAGVDKEVRLWEVTAGKELARLRGHQAPVSALGFAP